MRYLIFEYLCEGHYIEYIRHILNYANENMANDEFHIVVPKFYEKHMNSFPSSSKFIFHFLSDKDNKRLSKKGKLFLPIHSIIRCRIVSHYMKQYKIDRTVIITAINYIFGLALCMPRDSYVSAIEYIIPRHRPFNISILKKIEDRFRLWLYTNTPQLKNLFLLNDEKSAIFYNRQFKTSKFKFLPDPIDCLVSKSVDREIIKDKITLLHAGRFRKEKGTFDIFDALKLLDDAERKKFKFILCGGSIISEDNDKAIAEVEELKKIMDMEFYPGFVSEEFLHNLYLKSDYVLIPYHNYFQSSGNLGHAASYGRPVVGPREGLLGQLIGKYNLGVVLESLDADGIVKALRSILANNSKNYSFKDYVKRCDPIDFARILLN